MKVTKEFLLAREDTARVRTLLPPSRIRQPQLALRVALLVLLAGLMLLALWLGVARAEDVTGTWKGVFGPSDVVVTLAVKKARGDATLRFGSPRNCTLTARFELRAGATTRYGLPHSNGGTCDRFVGGRLTLLDGNPGQLTLVLLDAAANKREEVEMIAVK